MTTQIDFRTLPANVPVLCIPRVYSNISESRIRRIFEELNMGTLDRIDIVSKHGEKKEKFNRVFIHFRYWNNTENACIARERLLNGKEIKIIYDDPWFWKISAYREIERKSSPSSQYHAKSTVKLQFDNDETQKPPPIHPSFQIDETEERIMKGLNNSLSSKRDHNEYRHQPTHLHRHQPRHQPRHPPRDQPRDQPRDKPRHPPRDQPRPRQDNIDKYPQEDYKINYGDISVKQIRRKSKPLPEEKNQPVQPQVQVIEEQPVVETSK
jgi:hypothetical protein